MDTKCMPGASGGQKIVLDPLDLELKIATRHHMDGPGSSAGATCALQPLSL